MATQWQINVSQQEVMNRHVPFLPVLTKVVCIPPVAVESAVGKLRELSPKVEVCVEDQVEVSQPDVRGGD